MRRILELPGRQDQPVEAVARANPNLVAVLETGGPVLMPWLDRARAVLEAWYPGQKGGEAIAEILSGAINPSGRLPVTSPKAATQYSTRRYQAIRKGRRWVWSDAAVITARRS